MLGRPHVPLSPRREIVDVHDLTFACDHVAAATVAASLSAPTFQTFGPLHFYFLGGLNVAA